jgi:hypothetical protein
MFKKESKPEIGKVVDKLLEDFKEPPPPDQEVKIEVQSPRKNI